MSGGRLWRPQNYTAGQANGWVTMRQALERSLNLVTVRVAQQVGMDAVADSARRFGVIDNMPHYLALSLGAGETTVLHGLGLRRLREWRVSRHADADPIPCRTGVAASSWRADRAPARAAPRRA